MDVATVTQVRILNPDNTILAGSTNVAFSRISTGIYRHTISTTGFAVGTYNVVVRAVEADGGTVIETSQFVVRQVPGP